MSTEKSKKENFYDKTKYWKKYLTYILRRCRILLNIMKIYKLVQKIALNFM